MPISSQIERAVACAVRAPSLHNSQPWRFQRHGMSVLVWADRSRALEAEDARGRELVISCGGAVRHLVLGLRAEGLEVVTDLLPSPHADPDLLAIVAIVGEREPTAAELALHKAAASRHTERSPFTDEEVSGAVLDRLGELARRQRCSLEVLHGDDVLELAVLTDRADVLLGLDPAVQLEMSHWTTGQDEPREGMPRDATPGPVERRGSPVRLRDFGSGTAQAIADDPPPVENPSILVLTTPEDDTLAWLRTGWALSDLLLTLTVLGLAASPMTQSLQVPWVRAELRQGLHLWSYPQMVLRIGYPSRTSSPRTSRRPVSAVLT
jgi:hypothetical protein